jgi:uncharacterized protein YcbK (DUF882 family)
VAAGTVRSLIALAVTASGLFSSPQRPSPAADTAFELGPEALALDVSGGAIRIPLPAEPLFARTLPKPFSALPALTFVNLNGPTRATVRLYDDGGELDPPALAELDRALGDVRDPRSPRVAELDRRLYRVVARAAYHFGSSEIQVVSAYRAPGRRPEGPHGHAKALDFRLPGVTAADLGAYFRGIPRLGVGVYVHRRTQYVHVDVRDESYHWADGSPPGRTWREVSLHTAGLPALDAGWEPRGDLPSIWVRSP